jgi:3-oxoacyl-[acyl-carrier protein] reductase
MASQSTVSSGPVSTDMWMECEPDVLADFQPITEITPAAARVGEVSDIVPVMSYVARAVSVGYC